MFSRNRPVQFEFLDNTADIQVHACTARWQRVKSRGKLVPCGTRAMCLGNVRVRLAAVLRDV